MRQGVLIAAALGFQVRVPVSRPSDGMADARGVHPGRGQVNLREGRVVAWLGRVQVPTNCGAVSTGPTLVWVWLPRRRMEGTGGETESKGATRVRRKKETVRFDGGKRRPGFFVWPLGPTYGVCGLTRYATMASKGYGFRR